MQGVPVTYRPVDLLDWRGFQIALGHWALWRDTRADFAAPRLSRDQLVLFPEKLDQAIPPNHAVRLLDDILNKIDWTLWGKDYELRRGQPLIHPKIIAGAVLFGLLKRIRTSRALEEAIEFETISGGSFVEGRSIVHTTICKSFSKKRDIRKYCLAPSKIEFQMRGLGENR